MDVAVARRPARQHPRDGAHAGVHHDPARRRALQRRAAGCAPEARQPDRRAGAGDRRGRPGARASPLLPGVHLWSHADEHDQPRELREPTHRPELHRRQFARANRADDGLPGWAPPRRANYIADNSLARIALTTDCPAGLLPDGATGFHVLQQDQSFAGGTYTVCVRQWPDPNSDPPNQPSSDHQKAQFRSLGVLSSVTGTVARIVQIDATAAVTASKPHAPFSIGGPTSGAIKGNAVIAGPVQFLTCPGAGCVAVEFGGGGGLQNNYTQLDSNLRSRIPMLFPNGTPVSTLGAVLKVKEGLGKLNSGTPCIGKQETGSGCGGGAPAGIPGTMSGGSSNGPLGGTHMASAAPLKC